MRVQLIRIHEDGTCAKWNTDAGDLRLILVIPARPGVMRARRPSPDEGDDPFGWWMWE